MFVYILKSDKSQRYYLGSTTRPDDRLAEHNEGRVESTRNKGPRTRVALIRFSDSADARKAEAWIKKLKRRDIIDKIIFGQFLWPDNLTWIIHADSVNNFITY